MWNLKPKTVKPANAFKRLTLLESLSGDYILKTNIVTLTRKQRREPIYKFASYPLNKHENC